MSGEGHDRAHAEPGFLNAAGAIRCARGRGEIVRLKADLREARVERRSMS